MAARTRPDSGNPRTHPQVLIVGGGFAAVGCATHLIRRLRRAGSPVGVVVVSPQDYLLYTPLLPEVAGGSLDPRHVAVPLAGLMPHARLVTGEVEGVDLDARTVHLGDGSELGWDRLVLTPGSVTQLHDVPGAAEHALGLKTLAQALYLRDHIIGCLEDSTNESDERRRRAMRTVVVVGASYAGTELVSQLRALAASVAEHRGFAPSEVRFLLLDVADRVMPEIGASLAHRALQVLEGRGVDIRLGTTVRKMDGASVTLDDDSVVPTRTVAWVAGIHANPMVQATGLRLDHGRVIVEPDLGVPGHPDVFAAGDAAAVPDLVRGGGSTTPPTAQHATRQGRTLARNVAASLGIGSPIDYRHRDLGLVVDLGPSAAVADPFGLELSGFAAKVVTRGYHLGALPGWANRFGVGVDWVMDAAAPRPVVRLGLVRPDVAGFGSEHRGPVDT